MRNKPFPKYPDDTDYTTNAPSYYEDLARKEKLFRLLAERIWGYEKILDETLEQIQERFRAWDKNLEDFPEDVKILLQKWLDNGTLDHIINDTIFNWKLDTIIFEQFRDTITTQLAETVTLVGKREFSDSYDTNRIQKAIDLLGDMGGTVKVPRGVYELDPATPLLIPQNITLIGDGSSSTVLQSLVRRTTSLANVVGSNVTIRNIGFDLHEYDENSNLTEVACIEVTDSIENLNILSSSFKNGYAGIWLNPKNGAKIKGVRIKDCDLRKFRHHIYLGFTKLVETNRADYVKDVVIDGNQILDGLYDGDGIKTSQNCYDITIVNNTIRGHKRDAIDLYMSGDNVLIANNVLSDSGDKGLDIKSRVVPEFSTDLYGHNRRMVITGNIIDNNVHGVGVALGGVYLVDISNNTLTGNTGNGMMIHGTNINIANNLLFENSTTSGNAPIYLYGNEGSITRNVTISGNQILNNGGNSTTDTSGLRVSNYVEDVVITGNSITNDTTKPNPYQDVGLYVFALTKRITVKNNTINGHTKDVWLKNGCGVVGEKVYVPINTQVLPTGYINKTVLFSDKKLSIVSASFLNGVTIPANTTNYLSVRLRKNVDGELNPSSLATAETTQSKELKANIPLTVSRFDDTAIETNRNLILQNESVVFTFQSVDGDINIVDGMGIINYIDY